MYCECVCSPRRARVSRLPTPRHRFPAFRVTRVHRGCILAVRAGFHSSKRARKPCLGAPYPLSPIPRVPAPARRVHMRAVCLCGLGSGSVQPLT